MQNQLISPLAHLQLHQNLLQMEYHYEKEAYKEQTERAGIPRRVRQGVCWYPVLTGRSYYNSLNQLVVEINRREDRDVEHLFEYGRPVCFFTPTAGGKLRYLNFSATISYVQDDTMVVALPSPAALTDLLGMTDLGVQLYFDETSYRAMFSALEEVIKAKGTPLAHLRDVLLGSIAPVSRQLFPIRFPWLNRSQEEAVNRVLGAKEVSIVHGEDDNPRRGHLRDPPSRKSSPRLRPKQYRRGLDSRKAGR